MKILYINDFIYFIDGGAHVSACAHRDTLYDLYGKNNVDVISLVGPQKVEPQNDEILIIEEEKNKLRLFMNCIMGYTTYLNKTGINQILECIDKNGYDAIFIDNSIFGKLVKNIKEAHPDMPIVTYYHDVKASLGKDWKDKASLYKRPVYQAMIDNEKINQKYSDINLTLNPRESRLYVKAYGKEPDLELSVYMKVQLSNEYVQSDKQLSSPLKLLFVGSHYLPNVKGISWFIDNVLPNLGDRVVLQIAGSGMDELTQELKVIPANVNIMGHVDDLSKLYENADVVISPIFEGGGMKVKVAHASAFGKIVMGTDESFEGYQENIREEQWNRFFFRCNTANEFINAITTVTHDKKLRKFNSSIREYFEKYYSDEYAKETIGKAISMAIGKNKRGNRNDNN